ncbi:MAG: hypothetical protein LAT76_10505 [Schleiferiaceae bacterium]|nr:hypothetical protein [Schleiferiaceae bacterium]
MKNLVLLVWLSLVSGGCKVLQDNTALSHCVWDTPIVEVVVSGANGTRFLSTKANCTTDSCFVPSQLFINGKNIPFHFSKEPYGCQISSFVALDNDENQTIATTETNNNWGEKILNALTVSALLMDDTLNDTCYFDKVPVKMNAPNELLPSH